MTQLPEKITVFTPSFADERDRNAQNLTVKEVVSRLSPERFRVIMLYEDDPDSRLTGLENVELVRWRRHGNTLRCLAQCLRSRPDIYFFPREGPLDAAFIKLRHLLRLPTKMITYVVSGGLYNGPPRPTLDRNVRAGDAVYANCTYLSELIRQHWGRDAGTVYDGIDRRYFFANPNRRFEPDQNAVVLFAGSLRAYKRPDVFVRNAARWPDVQFRIAGIGEEELACRKLADEMRCRNVSFLGHLSSDRLGEEMRRADIFLFPSVIEGHPQVLGQAAACGLPVVAMNLYRPEFVVHNQTGFLASSDEELSTGLARLLQDVNIRRRFSESAASHSRRFDWDEVTRCWESAFEKVVVDDKAFCSDRKLCAQAHPR